MMCRSNGAMNESKGGENRERGDERMKCTRDGSCSKHLSHPSILEQTSGLAYFICFQLSTNDLWDSRSSRQTRIQFLYRDESELINRPNRRQIGSH